MGKWHGFRHPERNASQITAPPPRHHDRCARRRVFFWAACLGLLLIFLNVLSGIISSPLASAISTPATIQLKGSPSHPNKMSPTAGSKSLTRSSTPASPGQRIPSNSATTA
jgi:hypothetical protein